VLRAKGDGSSGEGTIITLMAGSGGCGATTLAFNLANELGAAREALLMDMDFDYGAIAPYLGLQGKFGIGDLLARDGRVDGNLVRSTAVTFSKNLHVLLSPVSVNAPQTEAADYPNLNEVLSACKQAYAHTIIDAPHVSRRVGATLAGASTAVLIVFQLTVKDIHSVRSLRAALVEGGLSENRIALVANRYDKNSSVTPHEAQEALGVKTLHLVANDYQTAVNNINFGRPLSETASASLLRRDIMQLINRLGLAPQVAGEPELARQKKTHPAGLWETLSAATRRSLLFPGATLTGARS
jgi:pilus assembly protein CpaE